MSASGMKCNVNGENVMVWAVLVDRFWN